jgi:tetratricopeptide (TPR) repeat protein
VAQCQEALTIDTQNRRLAAEAFDILALLRAVEGNLEEARRLNQEALSVADELRLPALATGYAWSRGWVEWYAEDWDAAETFFRQAYVGSQQSGDTGYVASLAAFLADVVARQGREHEALALTRESEALAAEDDLDAQAAWRMARALVSSRTGASESIDLARAALAIIEPTDHLLTRAAFLADAAEVFGRAGETPEARKRAISRQ